MRTNNADFVVSCKCYDVTEEFLKAASIYMNEFQKTAWINNFMLSEPVNMTAADVKNPSMIELVAF